MEQKKSISHIVAGLILAGIMIVISLGMSVIGGEVSQSPGGGMLTYVIIIAGLAIFINLYGRANNYYPSFGQLFSYGFKATSVLTLVFVIFLAIIALTFPEFKEKGLEAARLQMEKDNKMSDKEINDSLKMVSDYFWVFAIGGTVLVFIIVGCIGSLIGAAITKKRPYIPFDQPQS